MNWNTAPATVLGDPIMDLQGTSYFTLAIDDHWPGQPSHFTGA